MRESTDKLLKAAEAFCKEETAIRESRRLLKKCLNYSPMGYDEPGSPECKPEDERETWCVNCAARFDSKSAYRGSLRKRYQAKVRMMRAYARMTGQEQQKASCGRNADCPQAVAAIERVLAEDLKELLGAAERMLKAKESMGYVQRLDDWDGPTQRLRGALRKFRERRAGE
jgi:hypothetical protein